MPFTAHVAPPTVTLPRLKAITTGSIPGFADVMGNIDQSDASSFQSQDSWLSRLHATGGRLVFYGDDTWLRLFGSTALNASFFARSEGVSGFMTSVSRGGMREAEEQTIDDHHTDLSSHRSTPKSTAMSPAMYRERWNKTTGTR